MPLEKTSENRFFLDIFLPVFIRAVALLEREAIAYRERHPDRTFGKKILTKPSTSSTGLSLWPVVQTKEKEEEKKSESAGSKDSVEQQSSDDPKTTNVEKMIDLPSKIASLMLPKSTSAKVSVVLYTLFLLFFLSSFIFSLYIISLIVLADEHY